MAKIPTEVTSGDSYSNYSRTDTESVFGSEVDVWGTEDLTPADIMDDSFQVVFDADLAGEVGTGTIRVDDISVEVFFTLPFGEVYDPDALPPGAQSGWQDGAVGPSITGQPQFVVVGLGGAIYTSPDGFTWFEQQSGTAANLRSIAADNNGYVVAGDNGVMLTSPDGENWTLVDSGTDQPILAAVASRSTGAIVTAGGGGVVRTVKAGVVQSTRF